MTPQHKYLSILALLLCMSSCKENNPVVESKTTQPEDACLESDENRASSPTSKHTRYIALGDNEETVNSRKWGKNYSSPDPSYIGDDPSFLKSFKNPDSNKPNQ